MENWQPFCATPPPSHENEFDANQNDGLARYILKKRVLLFTGKEERKVRMNQTISDLQKEVQTAFLQDELLQDFGIEVLDSNGVVTLRGAVPTRDVRERAEEVARTLDGVTSVINEIDVV
jgi:hypothetical protein